MSPPLDSLSRIVDESDAPEQSLVVVNRTELDPVQRLLQTTFVDQPVAVVERQFPRR